MYKLIRLQLISTRDMLI